MFYRDIDIYIVATPIALAIPISVFAEMEVPNPCRLDSRLMASMIVQLPTAAVEARDELSFDNPARIHINDVVGRKDR